MNILQWIINQSSLRLAERRRCKSTFIAEVPDEDPVLRTDVQKVSPGAIIRANCTTPSSYPQMNVTWFINDVEVRKIKYLL